MAVETYIDLESLDPGDPDVQERALQFARTAARQYAMDPDEALDIAQQVLAKLVDKPPPENIEQKSAYLRRMVRNSAYDYFKRVYGRFKRSDLENIDDLPEGSQPTFETNFEHQLTLAKVWRELTEQERQILRLYILGYDRKQMTEKLLTGPRGDLRKPASGDYALVRQRLFRLFEKIRKLAVSKTKG